MTLLEVGQRVWTVLAESALGDAAARGVDRDMQPAELFDRFGEHAFDAFVVGDVDRVECSAQRFGDLGAGRRRQVDDRDRRTAIAQHLRRRTRHSRRAPDDDCLLAIDLH